MTPNLEEHQGVSPRRVLPSNETFVDGGDVGNGIETREDCSNVVKEEVLSLFDTAATELIPRTKAV